MLSGEPSAQQPRKAAVLQHPSVRLTGGTVGDDVVLEVDRCQGAPTTRTRRSLTAVDPKRHRQLVGYRQLDRLFVVGDRPAQSGDDRIPQPPAIDVVKKLLSEGCIVSAYDPAAEARSKEVIPPGPQMRYVDSPYAAAQDGDALLILNDWSEFAELDLAKLHYTLRYPIVIDGRNLYEAATMTEAGFTYLSVGRPGQAQSVDPITVFHTPKKREKISTGDLS